MRLGLLLLILIATLFGSSFWYQYLDTTCKIPVRYRIGNIDARFDTTEDEVKRIVKNAENLWEDALRTDVFIYDQSSNDVIINFVYDERQADADKEAELRADLDAKEGMSESVATQYELLIAEFRTLKKKYESEVVAYETALQTHNAEVSSWNDKGGAPKAVVEKLRARGESLADEQRALIERTEKLNAIAEKLNALGARGNELTTDYNAIVDAYNEEFTTAREFAQGDYKERTINIYEYTSEEELTIVLAHEFGHALSLDHVLGEDSVMYYLMEEQTTKNGIQDEDKAEFARVCTKKSMVERILSALTGT